MLAVGMMGVRRGVFTLTVMKDDGLRLGEAATSGRGLRAGILGQGRAGAGDPFERQMAGLLQLQAGRQTLARGPARGRHGRKKADATLILTFRGPPPGPLFQ